MSAWFNPAELRLDDFKRVVEVETRKGEYPLADDLRSEVLVYQAQRSSKELEAEWNRALSDGPGVFIVQGAYADTSVIDAATDQYHVILAQESLNSDDHKGDHFGKPGANARIWNSLQKLALAAPAVFVEYFANDSVATASRAWLGPNYQLTSQVNLVYPGGEAQQPHRDYHLGFQTDEEALRYPTQVHLMSPQLTLQGAIAHCDMPVESGPTMLLPHSHKYPMGYLAYRNPAFIEYFDVHRVQLPLSKGDALFFNPAVFHAAGTNRTPDVNRMANLLQVSSAFGRAMERLDRRAIVEAVYPALMNAVKRPDWTEAHTANVIAASAEGYPFPADLDTQQPIGGLAPASQAQIVRKAIEHNWDLATLIGQLHSPAE